MCQNTVATHNDVEHVATAVSAFAILSNLECDKYVLQSELTERDICCLEADGILSLPNY